MEVIYMWIWFMRFPQRQYCLMYWCHSTLMQRSFSQQSKSTNTTRNYFIAIALVWNTSYFIHFWCFHSSPWGLPEYEISLKRKMNLRAGIYQLPHGHCLTVMLNLSSATIQYRQVIHGKIQAGHIHRTCQKAY